MSDTDRLIRFAVVAEEMSYSRASKRLRVDQPWLSRQIQQLEAQLGFPLFVRTTRKIKLTANGEALFKHALELARTADQTREAIRLLRRDHSLTIAFGVNPYSFWVPARAALLEQFQTCYPRATVEISSNYTPRMMSKLNKRTLDVVLAPWPLDADGLDVLIIHSAPPSLLIPSTDSLARHSSVTLEQLRGRRIASTNPKLNPANYAADYLPFFEAGAIPVIVPEGQSALTHHATANQLIMISMGWPDSELGAPPGFVHAKIAPPIHNIEYALIRRPGPERLLVDQFWKVACNIAAGANGLALPAMIED